jgi:hypothetical protein
VERARAVHAAALVCNFGTTELLFCKNGNTALRTVDGTAAMCGYGSTVDGTAAMCGYGSTVDGTAAMCGYGSTHCDYTSDY